MNKRKARQMALRIAIELLETEADWVDPDYSNPNPSTVMFSKDFGCNLDDAKDCQRLKEALDAVRDGLLVKYQGFSDT